MIKQVLAIKTVMLPHSDQWHNSLGGRVPQTLFTIKFLLTYREKKGKEKRENGEK